MKISELINNLTIAKDEIGDVDVKIKKLYYEDWEDANVNKLEIVSDWNPAYIIIT